MRRNTPLITLLTGAVLGVALLIANMLATPSGKPASYSAAAASAAASAAPASTSAPAAAPASTSAPATEPSLASPSPAASSAAAAAAAPAPVAKSPAKATYAGRVGGGGGSVAVAIHGNQAIAYVCNGSTVEAWLKGTASGGRLVMTGKNGARLSATYSHRRVAGDVAAHGTDYSFAVHVVSKPSGLYTATADVRGAKIKAGWIVLPDGTQVGSFEGNANSDTPSAGEAPELDVATGTARAGDLILHAVPVDGLTGSGF